MTTLHSLHSQIVKEQKRIEMLKNTKGIDADFLKDETIKAKSLIERLQKQFNDIYESEN